MFEHDGKRADEALGPFFQNNQLCSFANVLHDEVVLSPTPTLPPRGQYTCHQENGSGEAVLTCTHNLCFKQK